MNNNPEEFDKLQKLLKLKRHELPPPGYFNNFSTKVVTRIETRRGGSFSETSELPWLTRLLMLLETNPFAAGIFGVSICGLLISGIAWSQQRTPADYAINQPNGLEIANNGLTARPSSWVATSSVDSFTPNVMPVSSTNGSLFSAVTAQPVSFSIEH